jgi:hypothetical protein
MTLLKRNINIVVDYRVHQIWINYLHCYEI